MSWTDTLMSRSGVSGGTHAKKSILARSPHTMRPLNMLPTADLGELRDPVLAVPAV